LALAVADGTHRRLHAKWFAALELPSDRPIVIGGDHNYPPFEFLDEKGRAAGYNVDLVRAVAEATGLDIRIRLGEWTAMMSALERGEIDAIMGMLYSSERDETFDFSQAHFVNHGVAVVRKEDGPPPSNATGLAGKRIVVQTGDIMHEFCRQNGLTNDLALVDSQETALRELAEGRHDVALVTRLSAFYWIEQEGWENLSVGQKALASPEYCFAVPQGSRALLAQLSEGLAAVSHSGEYKRIHEKWMGVYGDHFILGDILKYVAIVAGPLLLIALLALLWSWGLRKQVARRTAELREKETFIRAVLDNLPVGVAVNSLEPAIAQYMNDLFPTIYRTTRDRLEGPDQFWEAVYPDQEVRETLQAQVEADCRSGDPERMLWTDIPIERPGEPTTYVTAQNKLIPGTQLMISSVWDVTERKRVEEALRENEALLSRSQEIAHIGSWKLDLTTNRLTWSDEVYCIFGCKPQAFASTYKAFLDFAHPEDRAAVDEAYSRSVREGTAGYEIEHRIVRWNSDEVRYVHERCVHERDGSGTIVQSTGMVQDITERKRAEEALRESEENLRITLNSIGDAVISTDVDGRVVSINPVAEALTGWAGNEAVGQPLGEIFRIINEQTRRTVESPADNVLKTGEIVGLANHTLLIAKDGRETPIADSGAPIKNAAGEITGVVLVFRDQTDERAARRALQQSQQRLESMFRVAPVGIGLVRERVIMEANEWLCQMTGYSAEELIGQSARMLYPSQNEYEQVGIDKYRQIEENGRGSVETIWRCKDGSRINVVLSSTPLDPTDALKGVTFTALDITERKRLQDAIQKRIVALTHPLSDEVDVAFDSLFNLEEIQRIQDEFADATGTASLIILPDGTPITEPSNFVDMCNLIRATEKGCANCLKSDQAIGTYHPSGPFTQRCMSCGLWDAGANIMVGGKHIASWLVGQVRDDSQTDEQMRTYAREIGADEEQIIAAFHDVPVMSEAHFRQVAQALFTLANQLSTSAYQNMQQARFIFEQQQTERELRRLSTAIDQSPETVMITDTEGAIQYVNPAFEAVTGYSREEAIGQNPRILKSGRHDAGFYTAMWNTLLAGRVWEGRMVNKSKDGSLYTEDASIAPVKDPNGTITNYVGVKRDITAELEREDMLRQAQKMESVGRLAGGVAHDFNNFLMGIMGYADLCRDDLPEDHPVREWLDEITRETQRSANLTHQLLAFARRQTIAPKVIDLTDTVANMLKMLRRLIGEDIDLVWQPGAELWSVKIDPSQADQILANLCVNARDAIDGAGKVTIETENVSIDTDYCEEHIEATPGSYVMLAVSDDGCGMDHETLSYVFEPFFTTKSTGEGTGLGLATVYGIVKQNKGFINIYSEPGKGSTFRIYLPRDTSVRNTDTPAATKNEIQGGTETILLVEDAAAIRLTIRLFLERFGYTVIAAESPAEALQLAAEQSGPIDLLLTDVVMPGMSGRELAEKLAVDFPTLKVLYMSGYTANVIAHRGILDDGVQFISKPIGRDALAQKVREVLG